MAQQSVRDTSPEESRGFWERLEQETAGDAGLAGYVASGVRRHGLSFLAALVVTYGGVAIALLLVAGGAAFGALFGLAASLAATVAEFFGVGGAVFGAAAPGGIGGAGLGILAGAGVGALAGLAAWLNIFLSSAFGFGLPGFVFGWLTNMLPGLVAAVVLVALLVLLERAWLHLTGCRRMSARERERVLPVLEDVCSRMETPEDPLRGRPTILMHDRAEVVQAYAATRHIVLFRTVVDDLDDEELAGLVAHEVNHWRRADAVGLAFVTACALPIIVAYNLAVWSANNMPGLLTTIVWLFAWPAVASVRFILVPIVGIFSRRHEYEADRAAVEAGYGEGMFRILERVRDIEPGRSGWERTVAATHPPAELRLEAIERAMRVDLVGEGERNLGGERRYCENCGDALAAGDRFCGECGQVKS